MELSARLVEELTSVTLGVAGDGGGLVEDLAALIGTLTEAVSGYAGLRLTLLHTGHPVQVSAFLPRSDGTTILTSLRLPLSPIANAFSDGGRLVVWSTVAGSLVDLAADVGYVFRSPTPSGPRATDPVWLDLDLPAPAETSGVEGLEEWGTIHRASGVLIERGHDPDTAHEVLRRDALAAGLSAHAYAVLLLRP